VNDDRYHHDHSGADGDSSLAVAHTLNRLFFKFINTYPDPSMFFSSNSDFNERVSIRAADFCEQVVSEMGAELHDEIVQKLSSMSFYIERIERAANDPAEIINLVTRMRIDFENVTHSVRAISQRLNPVHITRDTFGNNIAQLCELMQRPVNGHISCTTVGDEQPLSQLSFVYLYRIVQELIHNAFKHSVAWKIDVMLSWTPGVLVIEVEDDGTGHMNIDGITSALQNKRNTLHMRSQAISATITYAKGKKGLLARIEYPLIGNSR
jgi:signal transduction histidine kinase